MNSDGEPGPPDRGEGMDKLEDEKAVKAHQRQQVQYRNQAVAAAQSEVARLF